MGREPGVTEKNAFVESKGNSLFGALKLQLVQSENRSERFASRSLQTPRLRGRGRAAASAVPLLGSDYSRLGARQRGEGDTTSILNVVFSRRLW